VRGRRGRGGLGKKGCEGWAKKQRGGARRIFRNVLFTNEYELSLEKNNDGTDEELLLGWISQH